MNLPAMLLAACPPWPILAGASIDGQTNVPLGAVLGSATTVFLVGWWVARKVTRFEEQQQQNMRSIDALERRLRSLERKQ